MTTSTVILCCLVSLFAGSAITFGLFKLNDSKRQARLKTEADQVVEAARRQSETDRSQLMLDAKEAALAIKTAAEEEISASRKTQMQREQKLDRREDQLQQQEDGLRKQQRGLEASQTRLATQMRGLTEQRAKLEKTVKEQLIVLEKASGMSRDQAGQKLMEALEQDLENERGSIILRHKKSLEEVLQVQAREMLLTAIQRYASAHTAE